jgi:UDP-N-acetyl-D-mannosaminuronate dehydrogenase
VIDEVIPVSSTTIAETAKLHENTFRAVNIALANELALMCDRLQISAWEVIDAAASKPFAFLPHYPGPGLGGDCIPVVRTSCPGACVGIAEPRDHAPAVARDGDGRYCDPWVASLRLAESTHHSTEWSPDAISDSDCVVMLTPHRRFLDEPHWRDAALIVDTRNVVPRGPNVWTI